ncbi:SRPBCC family protein [Rhodococcus sp. NPDC060090]|uniref:SRPBCC family protein n=1 Tax=Rhodococcus sp. NPDC060090 TaxID=3347056 RepID=UPI00364E8C6E
MKDVKTRTETLRRIIGHRVVDGKDAAVVTVSQSYPTDADDLWDACTNPERIPRWFLPISGELRVGGRYQFEGNAGGEVLTCTPPKSFSATWEFGGGMSWIEVSIIPEPGDCARFELSHIAHAEGDHWETYGPGAVGIGWDQALLGLGLHLDSGAAVDPAEFEKWSLSPQGLSYVREAGNGWCDADVAAGTDPEAARERADRTIAFYSGE